MAIVSSLIRAIDFNTTDKFEVMNVNKRNYRFIISYLNKGNGRAK